MNSNKKTLILFWTALTFALAMSGGYAWLFFSIKDKTIATTPISEKIEDITGREARIASSVSLLRREDANIEKLSAFFFSFKESEIVKFTRNIESLSEQSGALVTLDALEQGPGEKAAPYLNFRITAVGTFPQVYRLVLLLENFPGKIEWKTVNLTMEGTKAREAVIDPKTGEEIIPVTTVSDAPQWRLGALLTARNFIN